MNFFENIMPDHATSMIVSAIIVAVIINVNLRSNAPSIHSDFPNFGIGLYRLTFWTNIIIGSLFGVPSMLWLVANSYYMASNEMMEYATATERLKFMLTHNPKLPIPFVLMAIGVFLISSFICHIIAARPFAQELKQYAAEKTAEQEK